MNKKVTLNYNWGSLDDREPFVCGAGDVLELGFESAYTLTQAVVTLENTGSGKRRSVRTGELSRFPVPEELLTAGELHMKVGLLVNGEVVKEFTVEPLILKEVDGAIQAFPAVEELKAKLAAQEQNLQKIVENFNRFVDSTASEVEKLKTRIKTCEDRDAFNNLV